MLVGQTVASISIFCVHCFFMTRVWLIGKFHWILLPIGGFATAALVAGFFGVADSLQHKSFDEFQHPLIKLLLGIEACCAALADVLVTFQLCYSFFQFRTGIRRTDKLIQRLIQFLVTRGVLITISQICYLAIYYAGIERLYWMPFHFIMGKIYVITMFAILNSREKLRRIAGDVVTDGDFSYAMNSRLQTGQSENTISFNQPEFRNITEYSLLTMIQSVE
ncbi:hypothetical protein D9758_004407 [Tetrapyrgos nigripes]|uniref:DUF6534 domain-containing protein n=1 Tax=Tetrapyrgos nigripes TaxID=182062 RepID=A0A8H5LSM4_9AGAR|nr:hypothetical protein D9758_004407 [Tetrapyrgos nigripes]